MARKIKKLNYKTRLDNGLQQYITKIEKLSDKSSDTNLMKIRESYDHICNTFKSDIPPGTKITTKFLKIDKKNWLQSV